MADQTQEKRGETRLPFPMWAVPKTPGSKPWKVIDVSPGGAALIGESVVPEGSLMEVLLSAPFLEKAGGKLDVTATVEVVRHIYTESDNPVGMGVAWLHISASGPDSAFRDFIRSIICVETGFLQTSSDGNSSEYVFARSAMPIVGEAPGMSGASENESSKSPAAFQVTFPTIFQTDKVKGTGFAIKVMTHAMRIATKATPPDPYNRIKIGIKIGEDLLELAGTVGNVKKAQGEGQESRFDIQLSLGNNPGHLTSYRRHIEELARRTAERG